MPEAPAPPIESGGPSISDHSLSPSTFGSERTDAPAPVAPVALMPSASLDIETPAPPPVSTAASYLRQPQRARCSRGGGRGRGRRGRPRSSGVTRVSDASSMPAVGATLRKRAATRSLSPEPAGVRPRTIDVPPKPTANAIPQKGVVNQLEPALQEGLDQFPPTIENGDESGVIPKDPVLFSSRVIREVLGAVEELGKHTIWKIPRDHGSLPHDFTFLMILNPECNVEMPTGPMKKGAVLDIRFFEQMGELASDADLEFPLFTKVAQERYLYCGIYAMEAPAELSVKQWKSLREEVRSFWARYVTKGPFTKDITEQLRPLAHGSTRLSPGEVLPYFESNTSKSLRLQRTPVAPEVYEDAIYKALCEEAEMANQPAVKLSSIRAGPAATPVKAPKTPLRSTATPARTSAIRTPVRPSSGRKSKRLRIEEQSAEDGELHFPLSQSPSRSLRTNRGEGSSYNIKEMSRKSIGDSGLASDDEQGSRAADSDDEEDDFAPRKKRTGLRSSRLGGGRVVLDDSD
jgi:hypothetical protein